MTLAKPRNKKLGLLIIISGFVLLVASLSNVFVYNKIVNLQHFLKNREKEIQESRLANIDLKNQLYKLLDSANLIQLSQIEGLVKVRKPEYLEIISIINDNPISFYNINN